MFFLHALATRLRELERAGDVDGLAALPRVTCFEAADGPGGIWRFNNEGGSSVNMYESLWSNLPKEIIEFWDYSFEDHFRGRHVPTYLPREDVLNYLLMRTTSVDPELYQEPTIVGNRAFVQRRSYAVKFNTHVRRVEYNRTTEKFEVEWSSSTVHPIEKHSEGSNSSEGSIEDSLVELDMTTTKEQFDYCIWAAGKQGMPRIPRSLLRILRSGSSTSMSSDKAEENLQESPAPFKGKILHSSHMTNFESAVADKRVVLIGDSSSAEDLALYAVKLGADMIFVLSRSGFGDCVEHGSWPGTVNVATGKVEPKVKVHVALPYSTVQNGTGLKCWGMYYDQESEMYEIDEDEDPIVLEKIDTVIFCTGYVPNQDFLSPDLRFQRVDDEELFWTAPPNFQMKPNALSHVLGDVEPSEELDLSGHVIPGVYRDVSISNPRMMYLLESSAECPLLELDVSAWQCLSHIIDETAFPSKNDMERDVQERMEEELNIAYIRWYFDMNYFDAIDELPENHWSDDWSDPRAKELVRQYSAHFTGVLARKMRNAGYPVDFGTYGALNELGEKHLLLSLGNLTARFELDPSSREAEWRTFRDVDHSSFRSIFTGESAGPMPQRWLELDKANELASFTEPNVEKKVAELTKSIETNSRMEHPMPSHDTSQLTRPLVALIGCGPSGIFFLHALATQQRELERRGDTEGLAALPRVTCFEAADGPGGMWRSHSKDHSKENTPNMYEALWCNIPKEMMEFHDYTFEEHFGGRQVPAYLPRECMLEYIKQRAQSRGPGVFASASGQDISHEAFNVAEGKKIFDACMGKKTQNHISGNRLHSIKFQTRVRNVNYNSATKKFEILFDCSRGGKVKQEASMEQYDYCIWAGGQHGKPRIPRQLLRLLRSGVSLTGDTSSDEEEDEDEAVPYKGTILHSSHMSEFCAAVNGKRVVLIGDGGSAEDLALYAVKQRASMVYVLSRSGYGDSVDNGSWPGPVNSMTGKVEPKVKVHIALPCRVVQNGTGLMCAAMFWNEESESYEIDDDEDPIVLEKIDTVIFCTGYVPNQDCLSPDLRFQRVEESDEFWTAAADFKMRRNALTEELGDVEPSEDLDFSANTIPGVYQNVLLSNHRMMYMAERASEYPLLELDIAAWQCLAYITGKATLPEKRDIERIVKEQMEEEMQVPYLRWEIDMNYFDAINELPHNHWSDGWSDPRAKELMEQYARHLVGALARNMRNAKYPVDFGTAETLNDLGNKFFQLLLRKISSRRELDPDSKEAEWRTYRDADPLTFESIYTGQAAAPLPKRWLELDLDGSRTSFQLKN